MSDSEDAPTQFAISHDAFEDNMKRIDGDIIKLNRKMATLNQANDALIAGSINVMITSLTRKMLEHAPKLEDWHDKIEISQEWLHEQTRLAEEYLEYVRRSLSGTHWRYELGAVVHIAANEADRQVRQRSIEERPAHIDPYELHTYVTTRLQCQAVVGFLEQQKRDAEDSQLQRLHDLREQEHLKQSG